MHSVSFMLLSALTFALWTLQAMYTVAQSPYDPHARPPQEGTPWFEGWYTRFQGMQSSWAIGIGNTHGTLADQPQSVCFLMYQPYAGSQAPLSLVLKNAQSSL